MKPICWAMEQHSASIWAVHTPRALPWDAGPARTLGSSPPTSPREVEDVTPEDSSIGREELDSVACITSHSFSTWSMFNAPLRGVDSAALRLQQNMGFVEDRQFCGRIVIRSVRHSLDAFIIQQRHLQRAYSWFGKPMKHGGSCVTWAFSAAATLADNFNPALKSKWSFARDLIMLIGPLNRYSGAYWYSGRHVPVSSGPIFGSPVRPCFSALPFIWLDNFENNREICQCKLLLQYTSGKVLPATPVVLSSVQGAHTLASGSRFLLPFRFREAELPYCASALGPMRPPMILTSAPSTRVSEPVPTNGAGYSCYVSNLNWLRPVSQGRAEMGTQRWPVWDPVLAPSSPRLALAENFRNGLQEPMLKRWRLNCSKHILAVLQRTNYTENYEEK